MFFECYSFISSSYPLFFNIFAKDNPISRNCPSIEVTQTESGISRTEMSLYAFFLKNAPLSCLAQFHLRYIPLRIQNVCRTLFCSFQVDDHVVFSPLGFKQTLCAVFRNPFLYGGCFPAVHQ